MKKIIIIKQGNGYMAHFPEMPNLLGHGKSVAEAVGDLIANNNNALIHLGIMIVHR